MIEFCNVNYRWHYDNYDLFCDLNLTLKDGLNTVLCDIQSGKSSLCKLILGEILPQSGNVVVDGTATSSKKFLPSILYLPSEPTFFANRSVLYNLQYPLAVRKILAQNKQKAESLAQQFGLADVLQTKVRKLNASQKKTLALARGLTVPRQIVLFDGFFDDNSTSDFCAEKILPLFDGAQTIVNFTSNPNIAFGNVCVVADKKCAFCGTPEQAKQFVSQLQWLADKI